MTATISGATGDVYDFIDFDPFGPAFRDDPAGWYDRLLGISPGFMRMEGVPSAYVARHAHVTAVMRDFKRFVSTKPKGLPGMERIDFFNSQPVMNYSDPPVHNRLRRVINAAFQPKRVQQMADAMTRIIDELLDGIEEGMTIDVVDRITSKLAQRLLLGEFMSVPLEDHPMLLNFIGTLQLLDQMRPGDPKPQPYVDAWAAGRDYCNRQVAKARADGSDDSLMGVIARSNEEGALDDDEMMAMMVLLYVGGVGSIPTASASSIMNIARHPEVAERVRADPSVATLVLEESLRLDPPVPLVMRFCAEDVEIGGRTIPAGMPMYTMIAAASHDPEVWPDPYRFDIDRPNLKDHIAFGYGIHTCIGNAVTRQTVPKLVAEVARRFPKLSFPDPSRILWDARPRSRHLRFLELSF